MTLRVRQPVSLGDGGSAGTSGRRPVSASWRDNPRSGLRDRDRRADDVGREEINQVMQSSGPKQAAVVPVDGKPGSGWGASSLRSAAGRAVPDRDSATGFGVSQRPEGSKRGQCDGTGVSLFVAAKGLHWDRIACRVYPLMYLRDDREG